MRAWCAAQGGSHLQLQGRLGVPGGADGGAVAEHEGVVRGAGRVPPAAAGAAWRAR
eukprot:CAMPEP_0118923820 /NCGR_PEP_ID=MMETSP1169-20130426/2217_1 /TAXON_ID=36882 /ORGANISM="Pyramimonas obovata, Strain CCMP722" /LENGTH=55 /DNA_ID=CAMNT_0006864871 /DNA_START=14 /DNA_END=178 /DNA_ORIENTATION=+